MDWWKVAAVTSAGYAAKFKQNFSRDREGLSGSSIAEKPPKSRGNTAGRTDQQRCFDGGNRTLLERGSFQEIMCCNGILDAETALDSRFGGDYCDDSDSICEASTCGMGTMRSPTRGKSSLRSRRSNLHHLKPLSSLESCLMAQLYREHAGREEHLVDPFPSPCTPAFRPFLVTDGTQIISRLSCDSVNLQVRDDKDKAHMQVYTEANEAVFGGIPRIPPRRSREGSREKYLKKKKDENEKASSSLGMPNEMEISSRGSPNGSLLFCLGLSAGIISSILANKAEVTKLHDLLTQTKNLVQDLQGELEMKDSLTMKELENEDNVFQLANENSADIERTTKAPVHSDSDILTRFSAEASYTHKSAKTIESMSIIEAELEAELERLELNMKNSAISDDDELDLDLVADVVQGELRPDVFSLKSGSDPSCDHCSSSVSTPCAQKQAVSPRELSLRLHQVIQSRQEQHIMDLESALEKSQKRIVQLQSEQQLSSQKGFSCADMLSSSSVSSLRSSPITTRSGTPAETQGEPLIMNLSGEALDSYNELCHEFKKINGSKNEEHNFEAHRESEGEYINHRSLNSKQSRPAVVVPHISVTGIRTIEQSPKFPVDESTDEDDDMTLLIKQIVEKTRQGSPAVLHAHKAMVFLDKKDE